ncbi:hypothetical protein EBH_0036340 [Eimeria brunetti]|uniref:Uncharacterized protein n=1 Tax=Eimeria brunetti TaxID=51314 RepID=U6LK99_9EIME|nr:hypothetical protein EBH_0036340 [Eimeria brunetti]
MHASCRYTALATGGWATLAALLRRLLQQRLQRAALLQQQRQQQQQGGDSQEAELLLQQQDIERARKVDFTDFLRLANQHKFSGYQVDQWLKSNSFKAQFAVIEEDNCKRLVSNNWRRETPSQSTAA